MDKNELAKLGECFTLWDEGTGIIGNVFNVEGGITFTYSEGRIRPWNSNTTTVDDLHQQLTQALDEYKKLQMTQDQELAQ